MKINLDEDGFTNLRKDKGREEILLDERRIKSRTSTHSTLPSNSEEASDASTVEGRTPTPNSEIYGCEADCLQLGYHKVLATLEGKATVTSETEPFPLFSPLEPQSSADKAEGDLSPETDDSTDQPNEAPTLDGDSDSAFMALSRAIEGILPKPPPRLWAVDKTLRGRTPSEVYGDETADEVMSLASYVSEEQSSNSATPEVTAEVIVPGVMPIQDLEEIDDGSPSRLEWLRQRRKEGANNKYIDKMMAMVGLEDIKSHFLKMKARIETAQRQSVDLKKEYFNAAFIGNPGTGMAPLS
jgi:hypothetical protein